jgi:hypothetical protein
MKALIVSLALFGFAWLVHLVWWRIRLPTRQLPALAGVFGLVAFAAGVAWLFVPASLAAADIPAVASLYAGAAACYLIVYTGVEQTSPTLEIVRTLARAGEAGCAESDLAGVITEDLFVRPRLDALALDGLVMRSDGGWSLTPRGYRTARATAKLASLFSIREAA